MGGCYYCKTAYVHCAMRKMHALHTHMYITAKLGKSTPYYIVHTNMLFTHCMVSIYFSLWLFSFLFFSIHFFCSYHLLLFIPHKSAIEKEKKGESEAVNTIYHSNGNCDTKRARNVCSAIFSMVFAVALCNSSFLLLLLLNAFNNNFNKRSNVELEWNNGTNQLTILDVHFEWCTNHFSVELFNRFKLHIKRIEGKYT